MALTEFLNRVDGLKRVADFLSGGAGRRVLCVTGRPGCGKSALLQRALAKEREWCLVSVDLSKPPDGLPASTSLITTLAKQVDKQRVEDGFPARQTRLGNVTKRFWAFADAALTVGALGSKELAVAKMAKDRLPQLFPAFDRPDPDRLYVQDALRVRKCAIHIDHAETCSSGDWSVLATLLANTGCVLLLEGVGELEVARMLPAAPVCELKIQPLDISFAEMLFRSLPAFYEELITDFESSGSLKGYQALATRRHLLEPSSRRRVSFSDSISTFATSALLSLNDGDRQALIAISAHAGSAVGVGLLRRFFADENTKISVTTDVLALVRRLEDAILVVNCLEGVQVPQIVFDLIERDNTLSLSRLFFQKKWRDFYLDPNTCGLQLLDHRRCLQALRQCVMLQDGVGIATTLEAVNLAQEDAGSRIDTILFTNWLVSQFDLKAEPALAVAAARHLYSAGWFARARDILLAAGEPRTRRERFLVAELQCSAGPQDRGLRLAFHERDMLSEKYDPDAELCIELIIIHGLRNSNQFAEARARYNVAIIQQRFQKRAAYSILLRFADLCLMQDEDLEACCLLLQEAANLATQQHQYNEAVSAYVALSQQYGYHDLAVAETNLANAALLAERAWIQLPAILNNQAVIGLYRGIVSIAGLRLLEDALILSTDSLEEIIIRANILVHRALSGDVSDAGVNELLHCLDDESLDTEIRKIALYNLEQINRARGHEEAAELHGAAWRALKSSTDQAFWRARTSGEQVEGVPAWRLAMPYFPTYLSHWKLGTIPFDAVAD